MPSNFFSLPNEILLMVAEEAGSFGIDSLRSLWATNRHLNNLLSSFVELWNLTREVHRISLDAEYENRVKICLFRGANPIAAAARDTVRISDIKPWLYICNTTPLHHAARRGNIVVIEMLLAAAKLRKHGNKLIDAKDNLGRTALSWAIRSQHADAVWVLLLRGADVECLDSYGWTVLHYAAFAGLADIAELLLQSGARKCLDIRDVHGETPLFKASSPEVAKTLLDVLRFFPPPAYGQIG